ncbi:mammalian cell entry protein [Mycobacterium sp. B14F4]|uniref:mammalian cell entry protein n=1 Tax=Mycobacterium sp. B14F4 TaxID=3153565 RepID=UPI00325CA368
MEDQPADPGDLTTDAQTSEEAGTTAPKRRWFSRRRKVAAPFGDSAAEETVEAPVEEPAPARRVPTGKAARVKTEEPEEAVDEPVEAEEPVGVAESVAAEPEPEPLREVTFVPHRPAGKRLIAAAAAAGVLFVGAAAFAGAALQPYLAERAEVDTKLDVARTAASAISTLWTYTPDNMETLPDRSAGFLGGDFAYEYRKYIDAIVAPNKQAQVTNTTQVLGAAVETLTPSEATALVYTNSVATSPMTKNIPSLRYLSYRLTMERRDAKWLITRMSTVTSLDLTPQL